MLEGYPSECLIGSCERLRFPHDVAFSVSVMCSALCALVAMFTVCVMYVSLGSSVTSNIVRCVFMGSVVYLKCGFIFCKVWCE